MAWEILGADPNFEISVEYPHHIRRIGDTVNRSGSHDKDGYIIHTLNRRLWKHHRLVALQWIPNPDNLPFVDHIDHDVTNNSINNLRWVSNEANCQNPSSHNNIVYEYVDNIPDEAIVIDTYNNIVLADGYYYYDNIFYFFNGVKYRKLRICETKAGTLIVHVRKNNGVNTSITITKFKREYNID
jgi:hypothetical protein